MTELDNSIWYERYRPKKFEDLILQDKGRVLNYLNNPQSMPSFIFYSNKPGTGKTSCAKLMIKEWGCDSITLNSSIDRGIDAIREHVSNFARSLSSNPNAKRCIFLDEADGLTKQAQDSLRNLMEEYSDNCFFIFTANDLNKIIEPVRSRCQIISFENPNKASIVARLEFIAEENNMSLDIIERLVDRYYPDMRKMINKLNESSISGKPITFEEDEYNEFFKKITRRDVQGIYDTVYSGSFDCMAYNGWMFGRLFNNYQEANFEKVRQIALRLADTEKCYNQGTNLEVVFIANILDIMKLL